MLAGDHAILASQKPWRYVSPEETVERVKAVGAEHFVLGTDLGQTGNPSHVDGMKAMVAGLKAEGLTDAQIKLLARDNAAAMLGL